MCFAIYPSVTDFVLSYQCEALDISQCDVYGSCIIYENCAHQCVDLKAHSGAVCSDAPPKHVKARGAAWENDAASTYV
jgi:hypothetical protein